MKIPAARVLFTDRDQAEISQRITTALDTGALTLGTNTREFESAFAKAHAAPYAVAASSGTAALEIMLRCADVAGRDVIVPANTFAATGFAVLRAHTVVPRRAGLRHRSPFFLWAKQRRSAFGLVSQGRRAIGPSAA